MNMQHHIENDDLIALDNRIWKLKGELAELYQKRKGRIAWDDDDSAMYAWCVVCGEYTVNPNAGYDTCANCKPTTQHL